MFVKRKSDQTLMLHSSGKKRLVNKTEVILGGHFDKQDLANSSLSLRPLPPQVL